MSLFSIVAREDFLSLVLDNEASDPIHQLDQTIFHEIIPNQSFFLYLGQAELGKEGWHLAKTLTEQGLDLYEVALVIQHDWEEDLKSYFPKLNESLYYANNLTLQVKPMEALAQKLMMKGMASASQAQEAQFELFKEFTGVIPGTSSYIKCMLVEK